MKLDIDTWAARFDYFNEAPEEIKQTINSVKSYSDTVIFSVKAV